MKLSGPRPEEPGMWPLSRVVLWFTEKRSNLQQIKASAKINVINEEGKNRFDTFLVLNNDGEGRIEALGPWKSPIFCLVFNTDFVYLYIYNESTLYFGNNNPDYIQRLTGLPLDLSLVFDSLVSNLPEYLSQCFGSFSEEGDHSLLYMDCEEQDKCLNARIIIWDFPVIEEVAWIGEKKHDNFSVRYFGLGIYDGYTFSQDVHFKWPEGQEWHISFISIKVNQQVSKETFMADEKWFQGKVINLKDLDPLNSQIIND